MMSSTNLDGDFLEIWRRARNQSSLDLLTPDLVEAWARERQLVVEEVEEREIGAFGKTRSVVLKVKGGGACFPKIEANGNPTWQKWRQGADQTAALWEKMEWFSPLWLANGEIEALLKAISEAPRERSMQVFDYHTSTMYTLAFQAVCIAQIIPRARSLRGFCPLAREAYLAFYSGYRAVSIAALIPAVEGSLSRMLSGSEANLKTPVKVDRAVSRAIERAARLHFENMWCPKEYLTTEYLLGQDERIFIFETFRRWLRMFFFCHTKDYDGRSWLNRHLFAHGTSSSWQQPVNFRRLVVAMATLGAIESWHDGSGQGVSLLFPAMNDDSKFLWQQAILRGEAHSMLKSIEEKHYHDHGRLVPELPTDDGTLTRKAILSEECIKDLVRPLREAGWSIDVGEPVESGLYLTVVATSGRERLGVALLYSCATANETYRKLAETSDVILYLGAPYHQEEYAYGLKIHVGPVTGWQPPLAPSRRPPEDRFA